MPHRNDDNSPLALVLERACSARTTWPTIRLALRPSRGSVTIALTIALAAAGVLVGLPYVAAQLSEATRCSHCMAETRVAALGNAYLAWSLESETACPDRLEDLLPYTANKQLRDPWGERYLMVCRWRSPTDGRFGVISAGRDGVLGTEDDISHYRDAEQLEQPLHCPEP